MEFFKHLETCSKQERDDIAAELVRMYNTAIDREAEMFRAASPYEYAEQVGKLAMIQGVFDVLGIEFTPDVKIAAE